MSNNDEKETPDSIKAKCSWQFTCAVADMVAPCEHIQKKQANDVMQQIAVASLVQIVTGKPASVKITMDVEEGISKGFTAEIVSEGLEEMAQMDEKQIMTAVVPQLIQNCTPDAPDFGAFLNQLLSGIGKQNANDDGEQSEGEPAADKPQDQAAS